MNFCTRTTFRESMSYNTMNFHSTIKGTKFFYYEVNEILIDFSENKKAYELKLSTAFILRPKYKRSYIWENPRVKIIIL